MKRATWLSLALLTAALCLVSCRGSSTTWRSSQLAYSRETARGAQVSLWSRPGWMQAPPKLHLGTGALDPLAWSPSGRYLAVASRATHEGGSTVSVVGLPLGQLETYPVQCNPRSLAWAPDEGSLLWMCQALGPYGNGEIWRAERDSGEIELVRELPADVTGVDWSPDRTKLVATAHTQGADDRVLLLDLAGSLERVIYSQDLSGTAVWSPAGRSVAFVALRGGGGVGTARLCWYDLVRDRLRCNESLSGDPVWNNAGTALAYVHHGEDGCRWLASLDPVTGETQLLLGIDEYLMGGMRHVNLGSWSADDRYFAYESCRSAMNPRSCSVRIVRSDGKFDRGISILRFAGQRNPVWRPHSKCHEFEPGGSARLLGLDGAQQWQRCQCGGSVGPCARLGVPLLLR